MPRWPTLRVLPLGLRPPDTSRSEAGGSHVTPSWMAAVRRHRGARHGRGAGAHTSGPARSGPARRDADRARSLRHRASEGRPRHRGPHPGGAAATRRPARGDRADAAALGRPSGNRRAARRLRPGRGGQGDRSHRPARVPRHRRAAVGAADWQSRLRAGGRPRAAGGDRAGPSGDLQPAGRPVSAVRPGHQRRHHGHHRGFHRQGGARPGPADPRGRAAGPDAGGGERTVGPTLGAEAIAASTQAAIIGVSLTIAYMALYYRLMGGLSALALLCYGLLSFAVLLALRSTLTLPGIAGFVLAIGMAVDANVLVFERMKEEFRAGAGVRGALRRGSRNALSAIADSNVTTLLAALLLFFLASGAVRGFGVTLSVGVVVSMFTALVVTRVLVEVALRWRAVSERPRLLGVATGGRLRDWLATRQPNLLGRARWWLAGSALVLLVAAAGLVVRGPNLGLEFTGGRLLEYSTQHPVDPDAARSALAGSGFARAVVQKTRSGQLDDAGERRVQRAIESVGGSAERVRSEFIGPTIGAELRRKAIIAVGIALAAQLAYMAIRFRWTFGTAAVIAMFHDVAILLGLFAWLGKPLDGVFLAALLTVIGYSVNDSVVVFDRIRERLRERRREPLDTLVNDACLQTVPRTVNTGLGAMFILVALVVLGGDTLTDFALALLVGILVGTYSSVFVAAPLVVRLERGRAGTRRHRVRREGHSQAPGRPRSRPGVHAGPPDATAAAGAAQTTQAPGKAEATPMTGRSSRQAMDVNETPLPGVGLRYDFTTRSGRQVGVVSHRSGRRDLLVYDRKDPDTCTEVVQLTEEEADTLAEM